MGPAFAADSPLGNSVHGRAAITLATDAKSTERGCAKKLEFSKIRRTTDFALLCSVKGEFLVRDAVGGTGLVRWRDSPGSSTT